MKSFLLTLTCCLVIGFGSSCTSDESLEKKPVSASLVEEAEAFLNGDIVLNTKATLNGVDKTRLEDGCPTRFTFTWDEQDSLTIQLTNFTVGTMPLTINFRCKVGTMQLNSWEQDEYTGKGWFKFYGTDGQCWGEDIEDGTTSVASGSSVKGYFNAYTHEINFIVDYNMMNVRSECFLQTVDKSRIDNFDEEFAQYEADLLAYKKKNGEA